MNSKITKALLGCSLFFGLSVAQDPVDVNENEKVSAEEFGRKLGRAKKDNVISLGFMGGLDNRLWAYSLGYSRIVADGLGEVVIPFTYWQNTDDPENNSKTPITFIDPKTMIFATGLKYRVFYDEIDEGLYYGGGLRLNLVFSSYSRAQITSKNEKVNAPYNFFYQNFIPLSEIGYRHKFTPSWGVEASAELGWIFETFDPFNNLDKGKIPSDELDISGDNEKLPPFATTTVFYTINLNALYAF